MMLCKLSLKNITKSMKDYAIYFFTLILGVAIFYVFNAIESQTVMMDVSKNTADIIKLMTNLLSGVSVFVAFILGFLIIYASRFLIKRRNKEFGIYLTLGMSKRKISLILFFETLFIGIISLITGLIIGTGISQLMSILVANMFEADMTAFEFIFSKSACVKTLIYFGIMYLFVMIFNTFNINRCKLIDLLHANKKSEQVKMKNPWLCIIVFIIAVCMLGYAYYFVTSGIDKLEDTNDIFQPIILGIISTFFIFWSLSGLILKIVMSFKKIYYKGLNSFTLRQISSKINTTIFSISIICLMLFVTICVLSSALSIKNSMTANLDELAPVDIQITKYIPMDNDDYNQKIYEDSMLSIEQTFKNNHYDINKYLKDIVRYDTYINEEVSIQKTLGSDFDEFYLNGDNLETLMLISDYNKVAVLYGKDTYILKDDEYMIIADFDSAVSLRNKALKRGQMITFNKKEYTPKYRECKDGFIELSSNPINSGIILLPDSAKPYITKKITGLVANYKASSKEQKYIIDEDINKVVTSTYFKTSMMTNNTKIDIAEASKGLSALVTFIGLYLGIIFLISSAAILALKELAESTDNKERFGMLRKLGADERMINRALFRQIAIFFMFPLALAIIHSIFGIKFCTYILEVFGKEKLLASVGMTAIFLVLIYGGYFLITYLCSKNIIKEK